MTIALLLAESVEVAPWINGGIAGCALSFVLVRLEPRLRALERSNDRIARALVIFAMASRTDETTRAQAEAIIREIDARERE